MEENNNNVQNNSVVETPTTPTVEPVSNPTPPVVETPVVDGNTPESNSEPKKGSNKRLVVLFLIIVVLAAVAAVVLLNNKKEETPKKDNSSGTEEKTVTPPDDEETDDDGEDTDDVVDEKYKKQKQEDEASYSSKYSKTAIELFNIFREDTSLQLEIVDFGVPNSDKELEKNYKQNVVLTLLTPKKYNCYEVGIRIDPEDGPSEDGFKLACGHTGIVDEDTPTEELNKTQTDGYSADEFKTKYEQLFGKGTYTHSDFLHSYCDAYHYNKEKNLYLEYTWGTRCGGEETEIIKYQRIDSVEESDTKIVINTTVYFKSEETSKEYTKNIVYSFNKEASTGNYRIKVYTSV